jgi:hypothetical protein
MADATTISDAIQAGINRAADSGYTKTYDIAVFITTELSKAGLKIVNKPRVDGLIDGLYKVKRLGNDKVTVAGMRKASKSYGKVIPGYDGQGE